MKFDIRIISLVDQYERRKAAENEVGQHLCLQDALFFDAIEINGHNSFPFYNHARRTDLFGYGMSRGEIGCFASHAAIWKQAFDEKKTILILEDDFRVADQESLNAIFTDNNFEQHLNALGGVLKLQATWNTESMFSVNRLKTSKFTVQAYFNDPRGAVAYIITPNVAKQLLERMSRGVWCAVDDFLGAPYLCGVRCFYFKPFPFTYSRGKSCLEKLRRPHQGYKERIAIEGRRFPNDLRRISSSTRHVFKSLMSR